MSKLIENLKNEHARIANQFHQVNRLGVDTIEGRTMLMQCKCPLLDYLQQTDDKLPPAILEDIISNPRLSRIWLELKQETINFTRFCESFFEKYSAESSGFEMFRDFNTLQRSLEIHLQKEELLYYAGTHLKS